MFLGILLEFSVYALGYLIVIFLGSLVVTWILSRLKLTGEPEGIRGAGRFIGILERVLALSFVYLGQYQAIVILLAAKSIIRFEESKRRQFAEYFLIGTLSSLIVAIATGISINLVPLLLRQTEYVP